jgi:hypothetical protein
MLWHKELMITPTNTGGEFEHYRACALGVIAATPGTPVRHALSNSRRAG